ncbi:cytochrome C [Variovorax sp. Root473]|nr:cytochrome C [Variovorax sp. Root473]
MPSRRTAAGFLVLALLAGGCEVGERPLPYGDAPSAQRLSGQRLLAQYQCGSCHAIPGVAAVRPQTTGPVLAAFGRRSYIAGHVPNRPDTLARWIADPASLVPGTTMPAMGVSSSDARDMAAYLLALE